MEKLSLKSLVSLPVVVFHPLKTSANFYIFLIHHQKVKKLNNIITQNIFKTQTPSKLVHSFFKDAKNKNMDIFRHIFFSQQSKNVLLLISHENVGTTVEIYSLFIIKMLCNVTWFSKNTEPRFLRNFKVRDLDYVISLLC